MIEIDGSWGEGGGQILRTALAISAIFGLPCRIKNIRAGRKRPGLMAQHLTGVQAAAQLAGADVKGAFLGSTELIFVPKAKDRQLTTENQPLIWDVSAERGSAGAVTLVLQTVLPILLFSFKPLTATVRGGTHVPFSPIYEFFHCVLLSFLRSLGIEAEAQITSYGFYPLGGGEVLIHTKPVNKEKIKVRELLSSGRLKEIRMVSAVSHLPESIALRQANRLKERLPLEPETVDIKTVNGLCPGTYLFLEVKYENVTVGFSSLGEKGKPAERVADEVYEQFQNHQRSKMALDPHLADQVLIFLVLSGQPFVYTTSRVTKHLKTNIWTISQFLPQCSVELIDLGNQTAELRGLWR
ncbi:MAG: RNA 3'-terminal phosphate cyclase [candidate division WOR-3 bacterium]